MFQNIDILLFGRVQISIQPMQKDFPAPQQHCGPVTGFFEEARGANFRALSEIFQKSFKPTASVGRQS